MLSDAKSYARAAEDVIDEGFDALKFDLDVKVEPADTATRRLSADAVQHKVDIVEAVREAIGDEPTLGFDLHWNFSVETARRSPARSNSTRSTGSRTPSRRRTSTPT